MHCDPLPGQRASSGASWHYLYTSARMALCPAPRKAPTICDLRAALSRSPPSKREDKKTGDGGGPEKETSLELDDVGEATRTVHNSANKQKGFDRHSVREDFLYRILLFYTTTVERNETNRTTQHLFYASQSSNCDIGFESLCCVSMKNKWGHY